jgi:hypothetical protein
LSHASPPGAKVETTKLQFAVGGLTVAQIALPLAGLATAVLIDEIGGSEGQAPRKVVSSL